jgi:malonyl-CoA/methylmalonyl-CoA synthetase
VLTIGPDAWARHLPAGAHPFSLSDLSDGDNLLKVWSGRWSGYPTAPVLTQGTTTLNGERLAALTARAAAALSEGGVQPGERVLWSCSSTLDAIVGLIGALRLGAVVVPVNPALTAPEVEFVIKDARPAAAIVERGNGLADPAVRLFAPVDLAHAPPRPASTVLDAARPDDDALIVYTSGTTGTPKGAVHTHGSLLAGVCSIRVAWDWQPDDRLILTLPLFHVHGLCAGLFGTLAAGASAHVFERFQPAQVLEAASEATMFFGVPTMYHRLADSGGVAALSSLRLCVSGSAPLPAGLWQHLQRDSGVEVLERYGMSETLLTLSNPLTGERRPGSVGFPLPGVEAALTSVDEHGVGELMVRGPLLCRGYWGHPEASGSLRDGDWFATGDLVSVEDDDYITVRGRRTELIITGGHNVYPAEVEAVLGRHPSVGEIAVIGVASAEWGESVMAFVVGADGDPDIEALSALAAQDLAPYKRPREFRVVDSLPRNAMGKVVRRALKD